MSEFGKGFVYCLVNFAKHFDSAFRRNIPTDIMRESEQLSLWINGASDHLYELEYPKDCPQEIKDKCDEMRSIALEYGHGNKMMIGMSKTVYKDLRNKLNEICLLVDKWLEVENEVADYD